MVPTVAVLRGDGVGPEVIEAALSVLGAIHPVRIEEALIGGAAIDAKGDPLPPETLALCRQSQAVLLGAVGGPKWEGAARCGWRPDSRRRETSTSPGSPRCTTGSRAAGAGLDGGPGGPPLDYRPVVECEVIAAAETPPSHTPYAVFGNGGCPYSRDVSQAAPYVTRRSRRGRAAPQGCAFCTMGGDYDKRPDDETVASVLRQVGISPSTYPSRTRSCSPISIRCATCALLESAERRGVRDVTLLLETRADWLVEHRDALVKSIEIAERTRMRLELFLIGFESFSDEDLELFNKGTTRAGLLAAVDLAQSWRAPSDHFGLQPRAGPQLDPLSSLDVARARLLRARRCAPMGSPTSSMT
jgi:hypothetical protein